MLTISALTTELLTDPTKAGYRSFFAPSTHGNYYGDDNSVSDLLNTPRYPVLQSVCMADVTLWMVEYDAERRLQAQVSAVGRLGAVANGALRILSSPHVPVLMLADTRIMTLISALTPTVFSAGEISALVSMGTVSASRAAILFGQGTVVTPLDVAQALGR